MTHVLLRTSITVDEAVAILLGRSTGPIDYMPRDDVDGEDHHDDDDGSMFDLRETLEDELDVLIGDYELAEHEKRPPDFIDEKRSAVQHQKAVIERANLYLCAIYDELNKGAEAILKLDKTLSHAAYQYITLHSFNAWRETFLSDQLGREDEVDVAPASKEGIEKKGPRTKLRDQEDAILKAIQGLGLDPLALPPNPPGRPGAKAAVRDVLQGSAIFKGKKVFEKAWDRLRADRRIVDKT